MKWSFEIREIKWGKENNFVCITMYYGISGCVDNWLNNLFVAPSPSQNYYIIIMKRRTLHSIYYLYYFNAKINNVFVYRYYRFIDTLQFTLIANKWETGANYYLWHHNRNLWFFFIIRHDNVCVHVFIYKHHSKKSLFKFLRLFFVLTRKNR